MQIQQNRNMTKCDRLIAGIQNFIASGQLVENERLPTERQLAQEFGFSRVTIRRAMEKLEATGIINRVQGSGTYVRIQKTTKNLPSICFVFSCVHQTPSKNPYHLQLFTGILKGTQKCRTNLQFIQVEYGSNLEAHCKKNNLDICSWDGYLMTGDVATDEIIHFLRNQGKQLTVIGKKQFTEPISRVDIDARFGMYQGTRHLLERGYRRIALLLQDNNEGGVIGYREAIGEFEEPFCPDLLGHCIPWSQTSGQEETKKLLDKKIDFDAIIVSGDWATLGAYNTLRHAKPNDFALVCHDDFPWLSEVIPTPLTAIQQPFEDLACSGIEMLLQHLTNSELGIQTTILRPSLIVRDSTIKNNQKREEKKMEVES